jgi:hypothetical protein
MTVSLQLSVSLAMMEANVVKSMSVNPSEVRASSACKKLGKYGDKIFRRQCLQLYCEAS